MGQSLDPSLAERIRRALRPDFTRTLAARRIAAGLGYSDDVIVNGQAVWHPWCWAC